MRNAILLFVTIFLANGAFSQKSFEEFTQLDPKKQSKYIELWQVFKIDKYGMGIFPDMTKKELKKVALVAYTMYAAKEFQKSAGATYVRSATEYSVNHFSDQLYENSINEISAAFASNGIELITRENMNAAQKAVLSEVEGGGWLVDKEKDGVNKMSKSAFNVGIAVDGYKNWKVNFGTLFPWSNTAIARVAKAMEVDAVLLINNQVNLTGGFAFQSCLITMIGENPIPKVEGKKYPGLSYVDGMCYGQAVLTFNKPIVFAKTKGMIKRTIESENYDKFGEVNKILTEALLEDIKQRQVTDSK